MLEKGEKENKRDVMIMRNEDASSPLFATEIPRPSSCSPYLFHYHHNQKLFSGNSPSSSISSRICSRSSSYSPPSNNTSSSNGFSSSKESSPFSFSSSSPPFKDVNSNNLAWFGSSTSPDQFHGFNKNDSLIGVGGDDDEDDDDLGLCGNLSKMNIRDDDDDKGFTFGERRFENDKDGSFGSWFVSDHLGFDENVRCNEDKHDPFDGFKSGVFRDIARSVSDSVPVTLLGLECGGDQKGYSAVSHHVPNDLTFDSSCYDNRSSNSPLEQRQEDGRNKIQSQNHSDIRNNPYLNDAFVQSQQFGVQNYSNAVDPYLDYAFVQSQQSGLQNHSSNVNPYFGDVSLSSPQFGLDSNEGRELAEPLFSPGLVQPRIPCNVNEALSDPLWGDERTTRMPNNSVSQSAVKGAQGFEAFSSVDGLNMQGKSLNFSLNNEHFPSKGHKKNLQKEFSMRKTRMRGSSGQSLMDYSDMDMLPRVVSMAEVQGYVYLMAKDQNGCRFLQRVFDEGTALDMLIIFNEVISHVAELMMDPFGNYLMQKLLDVCSEEQRTQVVLKVTAEPGQLVRISSNMYGTRVVQKLVETLRTRKQISLVKSALRPGFLELSKDPNGNHVIQRCLLCLGREENKFIFEAAVKFCADLATHRHGCCVLQRCVAHSIGPLRDKLITEISRNSLLLAQDPYGNYVVQYIMDLKILTATDTVLSQFMGHYVQLSTQKFSSHVVERCLNHCPESRPQIIRELLSVPHFDQLMQDPFANFVIQLALNVTKGHLHASLVEAIRPHSILRNNPYCKRIFSRNFLKK